MEHEHEARVFGHDSVEWWPRRDGEEDVDGNRVIGCSRWYLLAAGPSFLGSAPMAS